MGNEEPRAVTRLLIEAIDELFMLHVMYHPENPEHTLDQAERNVKRVFELFNEVDQSDLTRFAGFQAAPFVCGEHDVSSYHDLVRRMLRSAALQLSARFAWGNWAEFEATHLLTMGERPTAEVFTSALGDIVQMHDLPYVRANAGYLRAQLEIEAARAGRQPLSQSKDEPGPKKDGRGRPSNASEYDAMVQRWEEEVKDLYDGDLKAFIDALARKHKKAAGTIRKEFAKRGYAMSAEKQRAK